MDDAHSILQHRRELTTAYTRLAKVDSHHQFVSTCLRNHAIPWGLYINIKLSVPKSLCQEPATRLEKKWAQITKQVAWGYLVALRHYHGSCARHLRLQVANLEVSIVTRLWRRNVLPAIKGTHSLKKAYGPKRHDLYHLFVCYTYPTCLFEIKSCAG